MLKSFELITGLVLQDISSKESFAVGNDKDLLRVYVVCQGTRTCCGAPLHVQAPPVTSSHVTVPVRLRGYSQRKSHQGKRQVQNGFHIY